MGRMIRFIGMMWAMGFMIWVMGCGKKMGFVDGFIAIIMSPPLGVWRDGRGYHGGYGMHGCGLYGDLGCMSGSSESHCRAWALPLVYYKGWAGISRGLWNAWMWMVWMWMVWGIGEHGILCVMDRNDREVCRAIPTAILSPCKKF